MKLFKRFQNYPRPIKVSAFITIILRLLSECGQSTPPLRVALLEWPPYELAFWAEHNGWLDKEKVQLLEYKTPAEVTRSFASGAVDIIAVTTDFALALAAQHPETRIVIVIDASNGGDVVLSRQALDPAQSLKGKTIAVEAGPLGNYMLARFLERFSLMPSDITIEYVDIPQQVDYWMNTDVDLLITYEPNKTRLLNEGAQVIFSSKDIPNEIVDVFLVRESLIKNRKSDLMHFTHAWFKAVDDLLSNKPELFSFIGERESIPADDIRAIFTEIYMPDVKANQALLSGQISEFIQGLKLNEQVMRDSNMLPSKVSINKDKIVSSLLVDGMN